MADAFQNRGKNSQLKKRIADAQKIKNCSSEYEGIWNHVHNLAIPALNLDSLAAIKAHLKSMGARAVETIHKSVTIGLKNESEFIKDEQTIWIRNAWMPNPWNIYKIYIYRTKKLHYQTGRPAS